MRKFRLAIIAALLTFVCGQALAVDTILRIPHGSTSVVLPCITLLDIGTAPEGAIAETGVTNATAGLEIKVRADVTNGWHAEHSQAATTINAITGTIGQFESPDVNDVHFEEVATGAGCYQLILPDSYYALDDGTTNCGGAACPAKALTILIRDSSSPAFRDTWVQVDLNVDSTTTVVDSTWDELCSGHTTGDTMGDQLCAILDSVKTDTGTTIPNKVDQAIANSNRGVLFASEVDTGGVTNQTNIISVSQPATDDWHDNRVMCIRDADNQQIDCARITAYATASGTWTLANALIFTVADGDEMFVPAPDGGEAIVAVQSDLDLLTGADGATLATAQGNYAPAKAGDAMGLTAGGVDLVWDELLSGHAVSGSTGEALSNAGSAGDPWATALPGAYTAGQAGKIVGDNLNATVSSRAQPGDAMDLAADAVDATAVATGAIDADALATDAANEIRDAIMNATVDGSIDVACYFAASLAYSSGKWTRSGDVVTYRNPGDTANRIVGTVQDPGFDTITITCP